MINYNLDKIRLMAFDVDGVLSLTTTPLASDGDPVRTANTKDGYALHFAAKIGFDLAIISGGCSERVAARYRKLGVGEVYMQCGCKLEVYEMLLDRYGLGDENVLYMGDDIPDLDIMRRCGLPCAPADAVPEVREAAVYVSHLRGGEGCCRDVVEQVLRAQGKWCLDTIW